MDNIRHCSEVNLMYILQAIKISIDLIIRQPANEWPHGCLRTIILKWRSGKTQICQTFTKMTTSESVEKLQNIFKHIVHLHKNLRFEAFDLVLIPAKKIQYM